MGKARALLWQSVRHKQRKLILLSVIVAEAMFFVELIGGIVAQSSSLLVDALGTSDMASGMEALSKKQISPELEANGTLIAGIFMACLCAGAVGLSIWNIVEGTLPSAIIMGGIGTLALVANTIAGIQLYRNRLGNAEVRGAWITTRNEALGNLCVVCGAAGVYATQTAWPDLIVTLVIVPFSLRHAYSLIVRSRVCRAVAAAEREKSRKRDRTIKRPSRTRR